MDYGTETSVDQIANLINDLKTNPDSRRLMVNAWNVGELDQMVLPPCHYGFQCYVRDGKYLSLMWNQRSVDTFLGLPFNIASYALLLTILAKEVNMIPDELIGNLGDTHLYLNHIEQAKEQIEREAFDLPTLNHLKEDSFYKSLSEDQSLYSHLDNTDFELVNYQSHPTIKAPLSN
jgi:thymidylate synthase